MQERHQRPNAIHRLNDVGARLAETITRTPGFPLARPMLRLSATESCTSATSPRRTGAPLL